MDAFPIFLAEVADKEPPFWFFYAVIAIGTIIALPVLKTKRLAIVALPLAMLSTFFSYAFIVEELWDPHVGPAIVTELGRGYAASAYGAAIIPLCLVTLFLLRTKKNA